MLTVLIAAGMWWWGCSIREIALFVFAVALIKFFNPARET